MARGDGRDERFVAGDPLEGGPLEFGEALETNTVDAAARERNRRIRVSEEKTRGIHPLSSEIGSLRGKIRDVALAQTAQLRRTAEDGKSVKGVVERLRISISRKVRAAGHSDSTRLAGLLERSLGYEDLQTALAHMRRSGYAVHTDLRGTKRNDAVVLSVYVSLPEGYSESSLWEGRRQRRTWLPFEVFQLGSVVRHWLMRDAVEAAKRGRQGLSYTLPTGEDAPKEDRDPIAALKLTGDARRSVGALRKTARRFESDARAAEALVEKMRVAHQKAQAAEATTMSPHGFNSRGRDREMGTTVLKMLDARRAAGIAKRAQIAEEERLIRADRGVNDADFGSRKRLNGEWVMGHPVQYRKQELGSGSIAYAPRAGAALADGASELALTFGDTVSFAETPKPKASRKMRRRARAIERAKTGRKRGEPRPANDLNGSIAAE